MGLVFSIEEFSVFDGPGIRNTVFLKGCPLHCTWCHNPEGQKPQNELVRSPNGCLKCGACVDNAAHTLTTDSITACPRHLIRYCAAEYTPQALCEKLLKNAPFLKEGGVTFSGGEPLYQFEFLMSCLKLLEGKLHRAIQTSGFAAEKQFGAVLQSCEYMLFDLKLLDDAAHKSFTGVSNALILRNFHALCESGLPHVIRMPLIPGVTDTKDNIAAVARLLQAYDREKYIELLPYNKAAGAKYAMVGRTYTPGFSEQNASNARIDIFEAHGIRAKVL